MAEAWQPGPAHEPRTGRVDKNGWGAAAVRIQIFGFLVL